MEGWQGPRREGGELGRKMVGIRVQGLGMEDAADDEWHVNKIKRTRTESEDGIVSLPPFLFE